MEKISINDIDDAISNEYLYHTDVNNWFSEEYNRILIQNIEIEVQYSGFYIASNNPISEIVFKNCIFINQPLTFSGNEDKQVNYIFESCTFKIPVCFSGNFEDVTFYRCIKNQSNEDKKCKFEKSLKVHGKFRRIKLDNIEVNGYTEISGIENNNIDDTFTISNSSFKNDCRIVRNNFQNLRITNSSFMSKGSNNEKSEDSNRKSLEIDANEFLHDVNIKNITVEISEKTHEIVTKSSFKIYENTFKGNCNLENINAKTLSIDISSLDPKKRLNIINNDDNKSEIDRLIFNRLPPRTYLENLNVGELDLSRNTIEDKEILSLTSLNINLLKIKNFINYGFFTINNIKPNGKSKIEIADSNLGKLDLVSCDLREFELQIDNSKLVDIFYTDTFFLKEKGSKEETEIGSNKEDNAKLEQQRDTYGQLKVVSEKVGNRFQALKFQAKEMAAYYEILEKWTLDKVTLWAMKWSNNFRQSWWQGVKFTFLVGLAPFIFFTWSLKNTVWCLDSWSCICETFKVFGYYPEFLNPAHKTDFVGKDNIGDWTYLWDFIGRIFIGFGIYQTIQAFRKFGKE